MSQWVHIRGGFELVSPPHEFKGKDPDRYCGSKDAYLPYPEEQMKLTAPKPYTFTKNKKGEKGMGLEFRAYLYSLPRAKKYIKEAFNLLPQGEVGWSYSINQSIHNGSSSSSNFDYPCDVKAFKQAITAMYKCEDEWSNYTYEDLKKYYGVELDWVEFINEIIIGIREDIRYCSGEEMLEGLEKFFNYLREHDIIVEDGYLEWEDGYASFWDKPYYYCWRCSRISDEMRTVYKFHKIEYKTNKILWTKTYSYPTVMEKRIDEEGKEYDYEATIFNPQELVTKEESFEDPAPAKAVSEKTND